MGERVLDDLSSDELLFGRIAVAGCASLLLIP